MVDNYLKPARTPGAVAALVRMTKTGVVSDGEADLRIPPPTLLVWGRDDGIVPLTDAERVRRDIAGARLAVIDDAGHMVHEEKPREVAAAILDFLRRGSMHGPAGNGRERLSWG